VTPRPLRSPLECDRVQAQAAFAGFEVFDADGGEFGAAERAGEARQQRPKNSEPGSGRRRAALTDTAPASIPTHPDLHSDAVPRTRCSVTALAHFHGIWMIIWGNFFRMAHVGGTP
jgi:hypothetical protein